MSQNYTIRSKRKSTKAEQRILRPVGHHIAKQHRCGMSPIEKQKEAEKILEDMSVKTPSLMENINQHIKRSSTDIKGVNLLIHIWTHLSQM